MSSILAIILVLISVIFSMTIHEAMHAFAGYWLADDTAKAQGRLSLNPIKHIDPVMTLLVPILMAISGGPIFGAAKPVPFNPERVKYGEWGAALVALAGPFVNLFLAFIFTGIGVAIGMSFTLTSGGLLEQFIAMMVFVNLGFFVFNMIPIPPLDGSRFLYALAPDFVRRGMEYMESFGVFLVFGLIILDSLSANSILGAIMNNGVKFFIDIFISFFGLFL